MARNTKSCLWFFCVVFVGACNSQPLPENAIGKTLPKSIQETERRALLPACWKSDGDAEHLRRTIHSWFEVMRYLDDCDLSRIRYYNWETNVQRILQTTRNYQDKAKGQCHVEVVELEGRFLSASRAIDDWLDQNRPLCTYGYYKSLSEDARKRLEQSVITTRCQIAGLFPELVDYSASECNHI